MRIALTGGTGFIGSHFLNQALSAGHEVQALRRSQSSKPRISLLKSPFWLERQLDEVTSEELVDCDVLVHLAAHTGNVPYDSLANCLRWNLNAVLALFEQAHMAGIKRFIVAGSCFEYGKSGERYKEIPTDAPLEPTNAYAASKAAATISLRQWAIEHEVSLEVLRIFHVYGEGELKTRLWPSLRQAAISGNDFEMTEGAQIRDFQPAEDIAKTFLNRACTEIYKKEVEILNLGTGNPRTIREFAEKWWRHWGAKGEIKFGAKQYRKDEVMTYVPKPSLYI